MFVFTKQLREAHPKANDELLNRLARDELIKPYASEYGQLFFKSDESNDLAIKQAVSKDLEVKIVTDYDEYANEQAANEDKQDRNIGTICMD